jgi:hypothetical protein
MTTISKDARLVTFTNVFTVDPSNQRRLVELPGSRDGDVGAARAGFHLGQPASQPRRHKVTIYAQWRTIEDHEAMRGNPGPRRFWSRPRASPASNSAGARSSSPGHLDQLWR